MREAELDFNVAEHPVVPVEGFDVLRAGTALLLVLHAGGGEPLCVAIGNDLAAQLIDAAYMALAAR